MCGFLTAGNRSQASLAQPAPSLRFTRPDCWQAVKEAYPIPLKESLPEWFGVGTRQSLNISNDLRHAVGKSFQLGDELAVRPQTNQCTSLGVRFTLSMMGVGQEDSF